MELHKEYERKCPKCEKLLYYSDKSKLKRAEKYNTKCKNCAKAGIPSPLKGKKQTEEHKRKRGEAVSKYRSGKSYEQLYGAEVAAELKKRHGDSLRGKKRAPFSEEWKVNMSESRKNSKVYKDWMNSEDYKNKRREINAMRFYGISLEEWKLMAGDKKLYWLKIRSVTRFQKLSTLENYDKRGGSKDDGYHLDHIYPVSLGYINNIPPEVIGDIKNLRYIPWRENLLKSNKMTEEAKKSIE